MSGGTSRLRRLLALAGARLRLAQHALVEVEDLVARSAARGSWVTITIVF